MSYFYKKINKTTVPELMNDEVHIWKIDINKMEHYIDQYVNLLSEYEKCRANKYRISSKRKSYILNRVILKFLIQHYVKNDLYILYQNKYGKPYLKGNEVYFNISYTEGMSLIAFSKNKEIGIDFENIKCDNSIIDISIKYFTKRERLWIESLTKSKKLEGFLHCWVRKEAYIKALGFGLSLSLDSFDVIPEKIHEITNDYMQIKEWFLYPLDIEKEYLGALCIQNPNITISYFDTFKFM